MLLTATATATIAVIVINNVSILTILSTFGLNNLSTLILACRVSCIAMPLLRLCLVFLLTLQRYGGFAVLSTLFGRFYAKKGVLLTCINDCVRTQPIFCLFGAFFAFSPQPVSASLFRPPKRGIFAGSFLRALPFRPPRNGFPPAQGKAAQGGNREKTARGGRRHRASRLAP